MGVILRASLRESAFLNVTIPEKDRYAPLSNANSASCGPPVKQWNTVLGGVSISSKILKVSGQASRV